LQKAPAILAFYRIYFTRIDPLIALFSAYLDYFDLDMVLTSVFPKSVSQPDHNMLLHQLGGFMLNYAFLDIFLLPYTKDIKVWKSVEIGILLTDFAFLNSLCVGLSVQGRLAPTAWRWEELGSLAITGSATLARILFLAEVGFSRNGAVTKKKS
ncbi:hypothetical protein K469DRAFT_550987, partial [Zopfia rhizophila CBS 207.26]